MDREAFSQKPLLKEGQINERQYVVELVRKWGDLNTDGILDADCRIFKLPNIEGFIGYRIKSGNAVVLGDPVCGQEDKAALAKAFQQYCEEQRLGVVYTVVSESFANWAVNHLFCVLIEFGEKLVLDPLNNPMEKTGTKAGLVRKKVKHALHEGAVVREYSGDDADLKHAIEQVAVSWLQSRKGPQVYMSHFSLFADTYGKRWFYAELEGRVVGVLLLNELQSHQGWLLNNLMMTKDAPNGISELLVISALQTLEKEKCRFVTVGPVPADQLGKITGLGHLSETMVRGIFRCAKKIFRLDGHRVFWEKFQPEIQSSYLLFPKKNLGFSSVKALFQAFNVGS